MLKRDCNRCEGREFRRLNRIGFFERRLLPLLGFFPWECALCRRKSYLHNEGLGKSKSIRPATTR